MSIVWASDATDLHGNSMPQRDDDVFFKIRMPASIHEALKEEAEANRRSISQEIVLRLQATFGLIGIEALADLSLANTVDILSVKNRKQLEHDAIREVVVQVLKDEGLLPSAKPTAKRRK
jgi:plasmid maintenance system antidote protein VapI